jgi:hypothetical protein
MKTLAYLRFLDKNQQSTKSSVAMLDGFKMLGGVQQHREDDMLDKPLEN